MVEAKGFFPASHNLGQPTVEKGSESGEPPVLRLLRFKVDDGDVSFSDPDVVSVIVSLSRGQKVELFRGGHHEEKVSAAGKSSVVDLFTPSRFKVRGSADFLMMRASLREVRDAMPEDHATVSPVFSDTKPDIERCGYRALLALHEGEELDALLASSLVAGLAQAVAEPPGRPLKGGLGPTRVRRVRDFLQASAAGPVARSPTLADLAEQVDLSVYHFVREFRRSFGRTPHAYMVRLRLDRAKALVAETRLPFIEISRRAGFASPSHFTQSFAHEFGLSPRALRRAIQL